MNGRAPLSLLAALVVALGACGDSTTLTGPQAEVAFERARAEVADGERLDIRGTRVPDPEKVPLIFVDGVVAEVSGGSLEGITPEDIDRIEVIKGVAAREQFGEEGANGVIRIFTRRN